MFYGIRARGPKDPRLDDTLDSIRADLLRWEDRDRRKKELSKKRKKKSAQYAAMRVRQTEMVVGPGPEIAAARKFYLACKTHDKEKLWDRLLNRSPEDRKQAKKTVRKRTKK